MKPILLYLFLVGVPVLAVSEVLRAGQRLRPPVFVEGTWMIERDAGAEASCSDDVISSDSTVLTISQSGPHLVLTLNGRNRTTLEGEIHDAKITAVTAGFASLSSPDSQGAAVPEIQLNATVERTSGSDRLLGALVFNPCPSITATPFSAKRQTTGPLQER